MTGYIANYQKKKELFEKREVQLQHAIKNNFSDKKIEKAAEKLREAKLQVFKSKFSQNSVLPASKYEPSGSELEWVEMSVEKIIDQYKD